MKTSTKSKILKMILIFAIFLAVTMLIYLPLHFSGAFEKIDSANDLKQVIKNGGVFSYAIFFLLQFLQTVILPIPAAVTTIAGTLVFGPWTTFVISLIAVFSGSLFCFFLGRRFGKKLVYWIAGKEDAEKWRTKLEKGKYVFFLMMLFPLFPDDILCLVIGTMTTMSYKFFITTNLITRPLAIGITCFFGSGNIIPFSGWGIPVWIGLFVVGVILFYLSIKYQKQIENFINNLSKKLSKKEKLKTTPDFQDKTTEENKTKNIS